MPRPVLLPLALLAALPACQRAPDAGAAAQGDPVAAQALGAQIMVDPDLVGLNPRGAALSGGGPATARIPLEDKGAETIAAARAEALKLGGGPISHAPPPAQGGTSGAGETAALTAGGALGVQGRACAGKVEYTAAWAARLPAQFPVYPRGHVQEAAGTDQGGCALRVVNYLTPVPAGEVTDFYWTRARAAGIAPRHRIEGGDHVISGSKGALGLTVYVREQGGMTEVDLVTTGG